MQGCTNPAAENFNGAANEEDFSCIYLEKVGDVCYAFADLKPDQKVNNSFTLSWNLKEKNWVYYHDYNPDFYFSSRDKLYSLTNGQIKRHNEGPPGDYMDGTIKPWFVDMVFASAESIILDSVEWRTEIVNIDGSEQELATITHITVWNNTQCSGRIDLSKELTNLVSPKLRRTKKGWTFDNFRDMLAAHGTAFLTSLFTDFRPIGIDNKKAWFKREAMEDVYFIVRLEFDNTSGKQLVFHGAKLEATLSPR